MRCHKPGTDQDATLTVKANGFPCPEFNLPFATSSDPNIVECFIPVTTGDQLTISGTFNGTCVHGAFDLLVDGTFVGDKRIEGLKTGDIKHWTRKLSYEKVFDTPIPPGYTSIYTPKEIVEGNLHARLLDDPLDPAQGDQLNVGSLAVIISVNQKSSDNYTHGYASTICGQWKKTKINRENAGDGAIPPTHELEVKVINGADALNKNRQSTHRRHFEQLRFGHKPWAKFIFYYRSRMAIETAGCVSRPDHSIALEPAAPGSFVAATKEDGRGKSGAKKKKKKKNFAEENVSDEDTIQVKSARRDLSIVSSAATTPSKSATAGQPTSSPREWRESSGLFVSMSSPATPSKPARAGQPTSSPRERREFSDGGLFMSPSPVKRSHVTENRERDLENEFTHRRGSFVQNTEDEDEGYQVLPGDEEMDEAPEEALASNSSDSASENIQVAQVNINERLPSVRGSVETKDTKTGVFVSESKDKQEVLDPAVQEEPLNTGVTASSSTIETPMPSVSPEDITGLASDHGVIDTAKLIKLFSDRKITYSAGLEVVAAVAKKVGSNHMLKNTEAGERRESPQVAKTSVPESEVPVMSEEVTEEVRIKAEPADKPKVTGHATTTQPDAASPPSTSAPQVPTSASTSAPKMPTLPSLKRPLSNDRLSRESTPNKKARLADLKAKKAALVAANQEKARKKIAAEKALEEERKRRAAEEDELLREIAEVEKEGMELDEETAELVKMREMEEDEV